MKKFTIIAALTLFFALPGLAGHVRPDAAQRAAQTFLSAKLAGQPQISLIDFADRASFPNLYVYGNDHCFVIMAADDCVQPVLGYSLTSNFGTESLPDNVRVWLQGYNDEIQYAVDHQMRAATETARQWEDLMAGNTSAAMSTLVVAPLIQTKWNQNEYYNNLCPLASGGPNGRAYTGCTATSMAQIMKYYNYPSKGIGSHSYLWNGQTLSANFGATTYDWNNMCLYYDYYYDDNGNVHWLSDPTSVQITAVATLMYHCGVSVDMNYSGSGSGASLYDAASALKTYFNYNPGIEYKVKSDYGDSEWKTMVKNELNAGRPLQYAGYNPNGGGGGHAFVCDGYNSSDYFHFNWGWAGHYDGYFSLSNLNSGNGVYTGGQEAIFGIRPSTNNATPTNLTYTLSGNNITLNWNGASGASSYNIYCNNNYVGNTTSTSYVTTAPFGTSSYYIRSVDSNGELSLPSNSISITISYQTPIVDDLQASVSGHNVNLSWTAPDWCYPETPTATLSYGDGDTYYSWTYTYYAHRYLAADLAQYANKAVYKVSTYVQYPGTYSAYVYVGSTNSGQPNSSGLSMSKLNIEVQSIGWYDFEADSPIILSGTQDLWVVMKQENTGQTYPTPSYNLPQHNTNAFYAGSSPTYLYDANSNYNCAWRIMAYVTDGTYTYNIYRNGSNIANNVGNTSYSDNNLANGTYSYYVKTNYYGGQTAASNTVSVEVGGTTNTYTITASANPSTGGTVSGGGIYNQGQTCTLTATANTGYTFTNWTKNGSVISTSPTYSFSVTANETYVANFTQSTYTITASANPSVGGSVSGSGTYNYNQTCTLTATANAGYTFTNWTKSGVIVSTNATYSFTVNASGSYVANFENSGVTPALSLPFVEQFDAPSLPDGWYIDNQGSNWSVSSTNNAGGTANEMHLNWSPQFNGISRLVSPPLNLTGLSSVGFSFKHTLDNYSGTNTIGIATSSDGGTTWHDAWSQGYNTSSSWSVNEVISTADMGHSSVRFCIYFSGNSYNINDWYFDDIQIFALADLDLGMTAINIADYIGSGSQIVSFNVFNYGTSSVTSLQATYEIDGEPVTETFYAIIPSMEIGFLNFNTPANMIPGSHQLTISIDLVNGQEDEVVDNNTLSKTISVAIGAAEKIPMIEHFSSSTCGPCVSVNAQMLNFCNNNAGRFTYTKYQMNWPGSGDPYYTNEGGTRRIYYGVSAVPQCFLDGEDQGFTAVQQNVFDQHAANNALMDIRGSFTVSGSTINVKADIMPYIDANARVYISVNEKETHGNVGSNGETSFHHIFMKMLPNAEGVSKSFTASTVQHLEYSYDMSSTHVEEMDDLEVAIWVQDYSTKEIFNSRFAYEYTNIHPYPVQNLSLTENGGALVATWNAPSQGSPIGYRVYLNGQVAYENTTALSCTFYGAYGYNAVGVQALYANGNNSVTVYSDITFDPGVETYLIQVSANPDNGGTVSGAGTYTQGATATLTATPNTGYNFTNWTKNGQEVSTNPTYSFTVTENATFVANFTVIPPEPTLQVVAEYYPDANDPYSPYARVYWAEDNGDAFDVQIGEGTNTTGYFPFYTLYNYSIAENLFLASELAEAGVTTAPMTSLSWYATNTTGYTQQGISIWMANVADSELTATSHTVGSMTLVYTGAMTPEIGWNEFVFNKANFAWDGSSNVLIFCQRNNGDWNSTVNWQAGNVGFNAMAYRYQDSGAYDVTVSNTMNISSTRPNIIMKANGGRSTYKIYRANCDESNSTLIANNVTGNEYIDNAWSGLATGSYIYGVKEGSSSIFWSNCIEKPEPIPYFDITATANPTAGGTVSGSGSYQQGQTCTLTATANTGYNFINWTKNGTQVSTNPTYSFIVTEAASYVANFEQITYQITTTANPSTGGTVSGAGTYNHGATATLTATANAGYNFINWTKNGLQVSTNPTYSFTVTEAASYVANFEQITYQITATANPTSGGSVNGAGSYPEGATCTLTATANSGYIFIEWTKDGATVSENPTYSFTVTESASYVARFILKVYVTITATANPTEYGTVSGGGGYYTGATCTLTATPNADYTFRNWTKDGVVVSTNPTYTFRVLEGGHYVGNFSDGITQTDAFANGWNWWSTYIESDDLLDQLESGLGSNGQTIKSQNGYVQYMPGYNIWYGSTGFSVTNEAFYMVQTNAPCAVAISGAQADPANHPITLATGWNWIGYPCTSHMNFTTAFSGITPSDNDQVKSQSHGFASYMAAYGIWYGTLADYGIDPGMGLMYKSNNSNSFSFTYPNGRNEGETMGYIAENNHWTADYNAYPNNMTVTAVVELDDVELNSDNYELAAFANDECRGSVRLMHVAPLNRYMAFLTVAGDESAELTFGLYNTENGAVETVCTPSLQYETNAVVGSLETPYIIRFRGTTGVDDWANSLHVFPNPVARGSQFTLGLTADEIGKVQIEIINALGVVETCRTTSVQTITAPDVAGVYTLRITVEGKGTCYRKLVVR